MEIAQIIINLFGFGILGWIIYGLTQRLKTQASILDEQNKMFEGAKAFLEFANPKNLKEVAEDIVALKEERMREENEKIKRELDKKFKTYQAESHKTTRTLLEELSAALELVGSLIYFLPRGSRKSAIQGVRNGMLKEIISQDIEKQPYVGDVFIEVLSGKIKNIPDTPTLESKIHKGTSGIVSLEGRAQAAKQMIDKDDEEPKQ